MGGDGMGETQWAFRRPASLFQPYLSCFIDFFFLNNSNNIFPFPRLAASV